MPACRCRVRVSPWWSRASTPSGVDVRRHLRKGWRLAQPPARFARMIAHRPPWWSFARTDHPGVRAVSRRTQPWPVRPGPENGVPSAMGLRLRLILVLMVPLMLVIGVYGYLRVEQEAEALLEDNRRAMGFTAKALQIAVENALRDRQISDATRLLSEIVEYQDEIDRIRIFDRQFKPLAVSNRLSIGDHVPREALARALE